MADDSSICGRHHSKEQGLQRALQVFREAQKIVKRPKTISEYDALSRSSK